MRILCGKGVGLTCAGSSSPDSYEWSTVGRADAPVVHVKAVVKDGAVGPWDAQANGPFEYSTYRPSESLYVLDLDRRIGFGDPAGARIRALRAREELSSDDAYRRP